MIELEEETVVGVGSSLPKKWFASVAQWGTWRTETYLISASTEQSAYHTLMDNLPLDWYLDYRLEEV